MPDNSVDTRIVEAKFDASDFKKGVDQTIKKLDELKNKLQLKDTEKSITEVASKTQEATEKTSKSLDKLSDRLTSFTGMIKQQILGGFAEKVSGAFFKIENSIMSLTRSLSTQQIGVGMRKYEEMLTSVRVMMSAGQSEASAYKAVETLASYSDQTSYSLDQMTSAMSKMVAAGVDLDTATKAVEGISNACADAGVNATDASRAFYNLSQAYSTGTLKYTDYRSLELLNMTTAEFKQQMLDAAVAAGTLKKSTKGIYTTTNKTDKKVTAGKKVNANNLSDALRYNFMNKEAMNQLFGSKYFFDEEKLREIMKKNNVDRESALEIAKKEYGEIAVKAYQAAREARSFTDVMNTLKDVISTGWSKTFELLIGKLEKATEFFTWLTENNLADAIYSVGEYRNSMLEVFAAGSDGDSILGIYGNSGRYNIIQAIKNLDEIFGEFSEMFSEFIPKPEVLGLRLRRLSRDFLQATERMKAWLDSKEVENGPTRLERIGEVFKSVANIINDASVIIKGALDLVGRLIGGTFSHLFDEGSGAEKSVSSLGSAFGNFKNILDSVHQTLQPILKVLPDFLRIVGDIAQFFINMAIDTFVMNIEWIADIIGLIVELFGGTSGQQLNEGKGVIEGIGDSINQLKEACSNAWRAVHDFVSSLIADIREFLGLNEQIEGESGKSGVFGNLVNYFQNNEFFANTKAWILQAFEDIKTWILDIPNKIGSLAQTMTDIWNNLLWEDKETWGFDENGNKKRVVVKVRTEFGKFIDDIVNTVKEFIKSIPSRIKGLFAKIGSFWDGLIWQNKSFWDVDEKGNRKKYTVRVKTAFGIMLTKIGNTIANFIKDIPKYLKEAIKGAGSLLRTIVNFLLGKSENQGEEKKAEADAKSGIQTFLESIFKDITLSSVLAYIKDLGITILNQIASIFTGTDDVETNQEWFANTIANGITWIKTKAVEAWTAIRDWFVNLPTTIGNIFKSNDAKGEDSPVIKAIKEFAGAIGTEIENIPTDIKIFFDNASVELEKLWANLYNKITGKTSIFGEDPNEDIREEVQKSLLPNPKVMGNKLLKGTSDPYRDTMLEVLEKKNAKKRTLSDEIIDVLSESLSDLGTKLTTFIDGDLTTWFSTAWTAIGGLWDKLYNWLKGLIVGEDGSTKDREKVDPTDVINNTAPTEDFKADETTPWGKFINSVKTFFEKAFENIGTWLAQGLELGVSGIDTAFKKLTGIFDTIDIGSIFGKEQDATKEAEKGLGIDEIVKMLTEGINEEDAEKLSPLLTSVLKLGNSIYNLITQTIPGFITSAWDFVSKSVSEVWTTYLDPMITGWYTEVTGQTQNPDGTPISNVGDALHNLITTVIPEKIKQAWEDIKTKVQNAWVYICGIFIGWVNDKTARTGTENQITNIGSALFAFITKIIPKWLSDAWSWIKDEATNVWTGLGNVFSEWAAQDDDPVKKKIGEIGQTIYNFITNDIPAYINKAFEDIKNLFIGKKNDPLKNIADAFYSIDQSTDIVKASRMMRKRMASVTEAPDKEPENNGFVGWISGIIDSIKTALKNMGPAILEGLNTALEWLGKLGTIIVDALTGDKSIADAVEDSAPGEESEIKKQLIKVGENLKTFFLHTVPQFIGAAIGTLIKEAPKWFDELFTGIFGAMNNSAEDVAKDAANEGKDQNAVEQGAEEVLKNSGNFITAVFDWLKNAASNAANVGIATIGTVALIVLGIMEVMKVIKELINTFNISGNWARAKEAGSSFGSVMKWLIAAVMAIMIFAGYVSTLDNDQFEKVKSVLDILQPVIITLASLFAADSVVGNITDTMQTFSNNKAGRIIDNATDNVEEQAGKFEKLTDSITNFGINIIDGVGGAAEKIIGAGGTAAAGTLIAGGVSSIIEMVLGDIANFGSTITGFVEQIKATVGILIEIKDDIATAITVMGQVIELVNKFPDIVAQKDNAPLASETLTSFTGGLSNFVQAVSGRHIKAKEVIEALQQLIGMTGAMTEFVKFANEGTTFQDFKYAIASLGSALSFYDGNAGNLDKVEDGYVERMVAIVSELFGNEKFKGLAQTISESEFPSASETYDKVESMIMFAGFIKRIAEACSGISKESGQNIQGLFDALGAVDLTPFKNEDGSITTFADSIGQIATALGNFATNTKDIKMEDVEAVDYALTMLSRIAHSIKDVGQGFIDKALFGVSDLNTFATGIRSIGSGIADFLDAIEGIKSVDNEGNVVEEGMESIKRDKELIELAGMLLQDLARSVHLLYSPITGAATIKGNDIKGLAEALPDLATNVKKFLVSLADSENWNEGSFDMKDISKINSVIGVIQKVAEFVSTISDIDWMQKKLTEFYNAVFTDKIYNAGTLKEARDYGMWSIVDAFLKQFGQIYATLKNSTYYGFTADEILSFSTRIKELFSAMASMTMIGYGANLKDFGTGMVYDAVEDSYQDIIEIITYFNDNMDVITSFLTGVSGFNENGARVAKTFFESMADLANAMTLFADIATINQGVRNLKNFNWSSLRGILDNIIEAFDYQLEDDSTKENLRSVGREIAKLVYEGVETALSTDDTLKPKITPIIDTTDVEAAKDQIRSLLGLHTDTTFDLSNVNAEVNAANPANNSGDVDHDYTGAIEGVGNDISDLAIHIDEIANKISGMSVMLDGRKLVGEIEYQIDLALGRRGFYASRGHANPADGYNIR